MKPIYSLLAILLLAIASCRDSSKNGTPTPPPKKQYACPMKCATSDQPGQCPKCGMEMKELDAQPPAPKKDG